jgi:hypothetical protein
LYMEERSKEGSVCERGVVGRLEVMLSSDVLLSWRERALLSPMLSVSSGRLSARLGWNAVGAASADWVPVSCMGSWKEASVLVKLLPGVGAGGEGAVVMALRRWMRSSCRASSFAGGGWGTLGVMAWSCVYT